MRGWKGQSTAGGRGLALRLGESARLRAECGRHPTPRAAQRRPRSSQRAGPAGTGGGQVRGGGVASWRRKPESSSRLVVRGKGSVSGIRPRPGPGAPGRDWFPGGGGAAGRGAGRGPGVECVRPLTCQRQRACSGPVSIMSFCSFFGGEVFQNHFEPGTICDIRGGQRGQGHTLARASLPSGGNGALEPLEWEGRVGVTAWGGAHMGKGDHGGGRSRVGGSESRVPERGGH